MKKLYWVVYVFCDYFEKQRVAYMWDQFAAYKLATEVNGYVQCVWRKS